jgi:hypothetical protein
MLNNLVTRKRGKEEREKRQKEYENLIMTMKILNEVLKRNERKN